MIPALFVRLEPYGSDEYIHPHNIIPPLDIGYAIALLKKSGLRSAFIDIPPSGKSEADVLSLVKKEQVRFAFIKFTTPSFERATMLAKRLNGTCIVLGMGQHPSALPGSCLDNGFHACIRGEPEEMIHKIVFQNEWKQRGVAYKEGGVINKGSILTVSELDALPLPEHTLFMRGYRSHYPARVKGAARWGFILASRGCPSSCIFCSPTLRASWGRVMRLRAPPLIVDEMEWLKRKGATVVYFIDDNIGAEKEWLLSLCDEMVRREVGLPWVAQLCMAAVGRELLGRMREAGCTTLCVGVESGVERNLRAIGKPHTILEVREAFRLMREHGFLTVAYFQMGIPGEDEDDVRRSISLAQELRPDMIQVSFFTPYPGSPAYESLGKGVRFSRFLHYNLIAINKSWMSEKKLLKLQKEFYRAFYLSPCFPFRYVKSRVRHLVANPLAELSLIVKALRALI